MASVFIIDEEIDLHRLVEKLALHHCVILNYCHAEQAAELLPLVRKHLNDEDRPVTHVAPELLVNDESWFPDQFWLGFSLNTVKVSERAMNAWVLAGSPEEFTYQE